LSSSQPADRRLFFGWHQINEMTETAIIARGLTEMGIGGKTARGVAILSKRFDG
jgi:hypothetical protein